MNIILFDDQNRDNLLPLTYTRPVAELRVGITTISEKWSFFLKEKPSFLTQNYLEKKYPTVITEFNILINGGIIPNLELVEAIKSLKSGELLKKGDDIIAIILDSVQIKHFNISEISEYKVVETKIDFLKINYPWDIFSLNEEIIKSDFEQITKGRTSKKINSTNRFLEEENIFIEEGAKITFATLNPAGGYIYIGKNAEIMEGAVVHGSLAMCESSVIKLSAKIYGATTLGPYSKVGGEVNNSVFQAYSNKGHDGFLGNSVLGAWCNLGADTNNSNLKNNYAEVKVWNYKKQGFAKTGLQFCGLIMGDHSKSGINTMFNTGTVVGVSSNIYGSGFPRNFVPSFSWGGASGFITYRLNKVFETAEIVMKRRNIVLDDTEKEILEHIFNKTQEYRKK